MNFREEKLQKDFKKFNDFKVFKMTFNVFHESHVSLKMAQVMVWLKLRLFTLNLISFKLFSTNPFTHATTIFYQTQTVPSHSLKIKSTKSTFLRDLTVDQNNFPEYPIYSLCPHSNIFNLPAKWNKFFRMLFKVFFSAQTHMRFCNLKHYPERSHRTIF